jgi:hypothetical protein
MPPALTKVASEKRALKFKKFVPMRAMSPSRTVSLIITLAEERMAYFVFERKQKPRRD